MQFTFEKFNREDFPEYISWYNDTELNMRLGPMDNAWLEHVMNEKNACEYSVFQYDELVAVIGIVFPNKEHPECCITDFAIKPLNREQGLGSKILNALLEHHKIETDQKWIAYVDKKNPRAKSFFEKNNWISSKEPNEHGMYKLQYPTHD